MKKNRKTKKVLDIDHEKVISMEGRKIKTKHKQVFLFNPFLDIEIEVDEELSELLEIVWSLGISTVMSCEESAPGIVGIRFHSMEALSRFLNVLATMDYSFYLREIELYSTWSFTLAIMDLNIIFDKKKHKFVRTGPLEICCFPEVFFPKEQYSKILTIMREYFFKGCPKKLVGGLE